MGDERLRVRTDVLRKDAMVEMSEIVLERQKIYKGDEVYGVKSQKIGIINPVVLMKVLSGKKKISNSLLIGNNMIEEINKYAAAANQDPVTKENLFAPDSVLFQPLVSEKIVKRFVPMVMMKHNTMSSAAIQKTMAVAVPNNNILTGSEVDASNPTPFGPPAKVDTVKTSTGADAPVTKTTSRDRREIIGDVIQGACLDCWFMAALCSWVWWRKSTPVLTPTNGIYKITFHSYNGTSWTHTDIFVKPVLPLNVSLQLVFAQQTLLDFEIWPALYEKAYGIYRKLPSFTISGATQGTCPGPYDPDTGLFPKGDPLIALMHISAYLSTEGTNNSAHLPTVYKTSDLTPLKTAFDVLKRFNNNATYTNWPTVAWTYAPDSGPYPYAFPQTWVWDNILAPSHSYSVLGTYEDTTANKKYIVLRNPWGLRVRKDDASPVFKNSLSSGIWKPDSALSPLNLNLGDNSYGIFGLENSAFEKYFEGFGWSQFTSVTPP